MRRKRAEEGKLWGKKVKDQMGIGGETGWEDNCAMRKNLGNSEALNLTKGYSTWPRELVR